MLLRLKVVNKKLTKSFLQAVDPLINTLKCLVNNSQDQPIVYLTQELRQTEAQKTMWTSFYDKLSDYFFIKQIPEEEQHVNYKSPDILLLKLSKK